MIKITLIRDKIKVIYSAQGILIAEDTGKIKQKQHVTGMLPYRVSLCFGQLPCCREISQKF